MGHAFQEPYSGKNPLTTDAKAAQLQDQSDKNKADQTKKTASRLAKGHVMRVVDPVTGEELNIKNADQEPDLKSTGANVLETNFPPPDWDQHRKQVAGTVTPSILAIAFTYAACFHISHLIPNTLLSASFVLVIPTLVAYTMNFRMHRASQVNFDDRVWHSEHMRGLRAGSDVDVDGQVTTEKRTNESAEWANALLRGIWKKSCGGGGRYITRYAVIFVRPERLILIYSAASESKTLIQDIPGKGKGVITRQHFSKGDVVFTKRPLFTQILTWSNTSVLASLFLCTPIEREHFYSLHNCHGPRKYPCELGIFETNVLPCGSNNAHGHVAQQGGVFLFAARFNLLCVPNRGQVVICALRDIAPGEELCIGYGKLLATREERRAEMKRKFWFELLRASPYEASITVSTEFNAILWRLIKGKVEGVHRECQGKPQKKLQCCQDFMLTCMHVGAFDRRSAVIVAGVEMSAEVAWGRVSMNGSEAQLVKLEEEVEEEVEGLSVMLPAC
ncbi:hypothetical protein BC835DRAFT_1473614 [Cytidiella melzeri]|nr:hypothetical protein BC835DRAFT_1473614 [Cytidiella melzeri]